MKSAGSTKATSLSLAREGSTSLKTTVPDFVVKQFDMNLNCYLLWHVREDNAGKKEIIVEVLKKQEISPESKKHIATSSAKLLYQMLKENPEDKELYTEFSRLLPKIKKLRFKS